MGNLVDMTGQQIGTWTVLERSWDGPRSSTSSWLCECECGKRQVFAGARLRKKIPLCRPAATPKKPSVIACTGMHGNTFHGSHFHARHDQRTPEYAAWLNMRQRRDVTVCDRWQIFENFLADMGLRPKWAGVLKRKDVWGPYNKKNCYWARKKEAAHWVSRKTVFLTHKSKTLSLSEWARIRRMKAVTLGHRKRAGWSDERALTAPVKRTRKKKKMRRAA